MTKQLAKFHAEVRDALPLLDRAISGGIDHFIASTFDQAVVDWRVYRIAEWSIRLGAGEREMVPAERWHALRSLRHIMAHRFETLDPMLMFVFAAMNVPKLEFAVRRALEKGVTP
ncbi:MAG: hypothetical protein EBX86_06610 [Actinobacteria bacterium]|jgi:uncharacterized protein with HEPN domain|nr:hypothetical protein [Acidimicrobiia bacterium]NDA39726.1 hypothetical protein [Actinomycetota bacterium]NDF69093.1 hypothetical protein [Actinomycetota bacterium]NDF82848.1 hypothetical protein [Actinomycetota bacterium]